MALTTVREYARDLIEIKQQRAMLNRRIDLARKATVDFMVNAMYRRYQRYCKSEMISDDDFGRWLLRMVHFELTFMPGSSRGAGIAVRRYWSIRYHHRFMNPQLDPLGLGDGAWCHEALADAINAKLAPGSMYRVRVESSFRHGFKSHGQVVEEGTCFAFLPARDKQASPERSYLHAV